MLKLQNLPYMRGNPFPNMFHISSLSQLDIEDAFTDDDLTLSKFLPMIPSSIKEINLISVGFQGTIPTTISVFHNLINLKISGDLMSGTLPSELGLLTELQSLDLEATTFTGMVPSEIGTLTQLTLLVLIDSGLNTTIPSEVTRLPNLQILQF
jgi:hypothetical protein